MALAAGVLAGCSSGSGESSAPKTPSALDYGSATVSEAMKKAMASPLGASGRWGVVVADPSGKVVEQVNPHEKFETASTAKIFSTSATLHTLGPDHRFVTPVVRTGNVDGKGVLAGDLVMVGNGDLTLGGRTKADGTVDVEDFDHYDANALPGMATLTPEDPLAGLNQLAEKVASSGIRQVKGDVIVDDRLWDPVSKYGVPITPTVINDNLIDLMITPKAAGSAAGLDWRPKTAAFQVTGHVVTGAPGSAPDVSVTSPAPGRIEVTGSVPSDAKPPFIATYQVPDPASFARTLLIEALARKGVSVEARPTGPNPAGQLPSRPEVAKLTRVAEYQSPPYSEYSKVINKVSHNLGAELGPLLMAVANGKRTYEDGMAIERAFVEKAGLDPKSFTLVDAEGGKGNQVTPEAMVQYLRYLQGLPEFKDFYDSMPIVGVDGSLKNVVAPNDPAVGHIRAKTGTGVDTEGEKITLRSKALAGYVDGPDGKLMPFAIYLNGAPIHEINDVLKANSLIGQMASSVYRPGQ
ncbi:D-alanyl-D-alanine carboxypeptidase/D-alanyl-D-alanine-endopeptidase [Streptomyces erythrochromogenes]|uniref:D-alanyl-D-alanine carboxypeptidase/D-alanyl-D-alanine endopeptidase n=1 Tax=Streptomyces erythrochromogenes TaxID=285574 RepID=UPI003429F56F